MRRRAASILLWSMLGLYAGVLLTLTHMPKPPGVFEGQNDKTLHFIAYFLFGGLLYLAAANTFSKRNYLSLMVLVVGIVFGALDEATQPIFGRHTDLLDFRSDVIGLICAITPLAILRHAIASRERAAGAKQPEVG